MLLWPLDVVLVGNTRTFYTVSEKGISIYALYNILLYSTKLTLIHKLNVMEWILLKLRNQQDRDINRKRICYRYDMSGDEVKALFDSGTSIIPGFTLIGHQNWIFVGYGIRGEKINIAGICLSGYNSHVMRLGWIYRLCSMEDTLKIMEDLIEEDVEKQIAHYCLLCPRVTKDDNFDFRYAVIFYEWDMLNYHGERTIPTLNRDMF